MQANPPVPPGMPAFYNSGIPITVTQGPRAVAALQQGVQSSNAPHDYPLLRALLFIGLGAKLVLIALAVWFCVMWYAQMDSFPKFWTGDFYKNLKLELKMWHNLESNYLGTYGKFNGTYRKEGDPSRQLLMLSSGNTVVIQMKSNDIEIKSVNHFTWDDRHNGKKTNEETHKIGLAVENGDISKQIIIRDNGDDNIKQTYLPSEELTAIQLAQLKAATHPYLTEDDKLLIQEL